VGAQPRRTAAQPDVAIDHDHVGTRAQGQHAEQARQLAAVEGAGLVRGHLRDPGDGLVLRRGRGPPAEPQAGGNRAAVAVIDIDTRQQNIASRGTLPLGRLAAPVSNRLTWA
jgi:hypothetical protein